MDELAEDYYARGREHTRLTSGTGRLEFWRTTELLARWLPAAPAVVLDVGGAAGAYALPLAARGHTVHLVDPAPVHVEQARAASAAAPEPLGSVALGDARDLEWPGASVDAVLLLGPLYHLTSAADRARALSEAFRVLRPGGVVVAAAITRWASALDAVARGWLADDEFARIVSDDVRTGLHRNDSARPGWFTTAYFHRPEEFAAELAAAGFAVEGPVAVEGLGELATDDLLDDPVARERLLALVRATEREPGLLGLGGHLLACGTRPSPP
ncbi:class I SAM-dependent methyltransferase [Kineococcus sp. SYSU DK003]|uniref:class I SAM-dependent methyltransferase n=1 Tax=Kineococcus sp. SYSU DK003 TaxID=3383124 RepID=UPI003D7C4F82